MVSTAPPSAQRPPGARPPARPPQGASPAATAIDPRKLLLQYWPWMIGAGFMGIVLGIGVHFALLKTYPLFDGTVYFEFYSSIERADDARQMSDSSEAEIERFIGSQVARMISESTLKKAVQDPQVRSDTRWIRPYTKNGAIDIPDASLELEEITKARLLPDSNIVELKVTTTNKTDCATLVKAIKEAYLDALRQEQRERSLDLLEPLNRRLTATQEERVLKQERMSRLFEESDLDTLEEQLSLEQTEIENLLPVVVDTSYNLELYREQQAQYQAMLNNPGGPKFPEDVKLQVEQDPIMLNLRGQIAQLKASLLAVQEQYGPNHREARRLERIITGTTIQTEKEREKLHGERFAETMESLQVQIQNLSATLEETEAQLNDARIKLTELNRIRQDYETLEEETVRLAEQELELKDRIDEQQAVLQRSDSTRVNVIQDAQRPDRPSFPKWFIVMPVVAFLCVMATAGVILLRELMEQRVRGPADLRAVPRARVLGVLPALSEDPSRPDAFETAVRDRPAGVVAECVRQLRGDLLKKMIRGNHKSLLIMGGMPESGATSVVINLAISMAANQYRVLVVDANLRKSKVHAIMNVAGYPGLCEAMEGEVQLADVIQKTDFDGIDVLAAGEADQASFERLSSEAMKRQIAQVRDQYDFVLIDSAPAIVSSDAMALAQHADASALVVRAFGEKRGLVGRIGGQLEDSHSDYLGVIINAVRASAGGYFRRNFRATHAYVRDMPDRGASIDQLRAPETVERKKKEEASDSSANGEIEH